MSYIDGFLVPVPIANKAAYQKMAAEAAIVYGEYGALQVMECWGDDLPKGTDTDMLMAVKAEEGENVVFSWIVWPSKEARDVGNEKVMADPRMQFTDELPFSGKRLIWGGFAPLF